MFVEVFVYDLRRAACTESESDTYDDIAITLRRIKDAFTIFEATLLVGKLDEISRFAVKTANRNDSFRNFLSVSANVLNRRTADRTWNSAQTFESGKAFLNAFCNK